MEPIAAFFRCHLDEKVSAYRMIKNSIGAPMATASAVHILVKTEQEAEALKQKLAKGADFAVLAKKHSICPSGKKGGDLGEFRKGQMVKAFDQVVFTKPLYKIHGPVKTQFGYHLIKTLYRS